MHQMSMMKKSKELDLVSTMLESLSDHFKSSIYSFKKNLRDIRRNKSCIANQVGNAPFTPIHIYLGSQSRNSLNVDDQCRSCPIVRWTANRLFLSLSGFFPKPGTLEQKLGLGPTSLSLSLLLLFIYLALFIAIFRLKIPKTRKKPKCYRHKIG